MFLNLINNVYIKNSQASRVGTSEIIDEEESNCEGNNRPFGYVDSQGRFMASSQAEVDTIYKKFYPLIVNKRKNNTKISTYKLKEVQQSRQSSS